MTPWAEAEDPGPAGERVPAVEIGGAAALVVRAQRLLDAGDSGPATALARDAAELAGRTGDAPAGAAALVLLAACLHRTDAYAESMETGLRALKLCRDLGDIAGESLARTTIARVLILTGDMAEALDEGLAALEAADLSGDLRARRVALTAVGIVHLSLRQHDTAMQYTERAAETARLEGNLVAHGNLIDTIACVHLSTAYEARENGDEAAAIAHAETAAERSREAVAVAREARHRYYEGTATGNLAEALAFAGRPAEGLALMEAFDVDQETDVVSMVTQHLDCRGCILMALGRHDQAVELFAAALRLAAGKNTAMWYSEHLSEAYEKAGDLRAALDHHKRFHALFKQVASETAQRNAEVAAIRLETARAKAAAEHERDRAEQLQRSNRRLSAHAELLLRQSLEDPLTGLANRRSMDRLLATGGRRYTVGLVDVDHFKAVNDEHSHRVGDDVLRQLGRLLRDGCRATDTAVRYGGEEFALLWDDLGGGAAVAAGERIRVLVELFDWTTVAPGLRITVSVGVAASTEADSPGAALELADTRLYAAKHAGRNRVVGPDF